MTCQDVAPKLSAFLDGELLDAERMVVGQHLDTCEPCAAEYRSLAFAWERLGQLPRAEPRAHLWPGIEARIARETARRGRRWFVWHPFPALATVALIVGLLLGLRLGGFVVNRGAPPTRAVSETDVDPLQVRYFGDVFPGSLPEAVLNVGPETRTSQREGVRR
jgi:anti-sigma factor RsiW